MDSLSLNTFLTAHSSAYLASGKLNNSKDPEFSQGSKDDQEAPQVLFRKQNRASWITIVRKPSGKVKSYLEGIGGQKERLMLKGIPDRLKSEYVGSARNLLNDSDICLKSRQVDVFVRLKGGMMQPNNQIKEDPKKTKAAQAAYVLGKKLEEGRDFLKALEAYKEAAQGGVLLAEAAYQELHEKLQSQTNEKYTESKSSSSHSSRQSEILNEFKDERNKEGKTEDVEKNKAHNAINDFLYTLPSELLINISEHFDKVTIKHASQVCKNWRAFIQKYTIPERKRVTRQILNFDTLRLIRNDPDHAFYLLDNCKSFIDIALESILDPKSDIHFQLIPSNEFNSTDLNKLITMSSTRLKELFLRSCSKLTVSDLTGLTQLSSLTSLDLQGCENLTDSVLNNLMQLSPLTQLRLGSNKRLTISGIMCLSQLPRLACLKFDNFSQLTNDSLNQLTRQLPGLRYLELSRCKNLTTIGLNDDLANLVNLTELRLCEWNDKHAITDSVLDSIIRQFPQLESLDLTSCKELTFDGLTKITKLKELKYLSLANIPELTDGLLNQFVDHLPKLKSLNIGGWSHLTADGVIKLEALSSLETLDISGWPLSKLGPDQCKNLADRLKNVEICGIGMTTSLGSVVTRVTRV